ncbi:hypothetical protein Pcac1_g9795 [Phytophthora cactorum]|nr:hypothetical protein Pcac1_g9795 [Phytophthora cactorum]
MEIFKWMEWIVARNHALSEVDDPLTRSLAAVKPISSKTLIRYTWLSRLGRESRRT